MNEEKMKEVLKKYYAVTINDLIALEEINRLNHVLKPYGTYDWNSDKVIIDENALLKRLTKEIDKDLVKKGYIESSNDIIYFNIAFDLIDITSTTLPNNLSIAHLTEVLSDIPISPSIRKELLESGKRIIKTIEQIIFDIKHDDDFKNTLFHSLEEIEDVEPKNVDLECKFVKQDFKQYFSSNLNRHIAFMICDVLNNDSIMYYYVKETNDTAITIGVVKNIHDDKESEIVFKPDNQYVDYYLKHDNGIIKSNKFFDNKNTLELDDLPLMVKNVIVSYQYFANYFKNL